MHEAITFLVTNQIFVSALAPHRTKKKKEKEKKIEKANDSQSQKMHPTFSVHLRHLTTQRTFTFHPTWFSILSFITLLFIPIKKMMTSSSLNLYQGRELKQALKREPFELRNSCHRINKFQVRQSHLLAHTTYLKRHPIH